LLDGEEICLVTKIIPQAGESILIKVEFGKRRRFTVYFYRFEIAFWRRWNRGG
jgi:hypothetical protein